MDDYERERADALAQEAMTEGAYKRMAVNQFAAVHGAEKPESAWILSPYDSWERNPAYRGPPVRHPEDDYD